MATAVSGRWPRAASAGSLGQANPQALIGQSAATALGFWPFRVLQFTVWSRTYPMATAVSGRWPRAASAGSLGQANPQALIGQSAATASGSSVFFSSPFGREHARWRLRFLVVGPEQLRRAL
jgi:hypothetical protein